MYQMRKIKTLIAVSTATMLAMGSFALADTPKISVTAQNIERPILVLPPVNNIGNNEIQRKYITYKQTVERLANSLLNVDVREKYLQALKAMDFEKDTYESKIERLAVMEREIRILLNGENKILPLPITDPRPMPLPVPEPRPMPLPVPQPLPPAKEDRPLANNDKKAEKAIQQQYLEQMQKMRTMIAGLKESTKKAELVRMVQAIHTTRDTYESKLMRLVELEIDIIATYNSTVAAGLENRIIETTARSAQLVENLGKEKALELRVQLAERKALLEAQKQLKQAEKQALRARAVEDRLFIHGKTMKFDVPPVIREGRTLVPVRAISEGLGAQVDWNQDLKKVTVTKDGKVIELILGSNVVTVNGQPHQLDVPAQLMNNRTLVPIRFISEILGVSVDYIDETGDIDIGLGDLDSLDLLEKDADLAELDELLAIIEEQITAELQQ